MLPNPSSILALDVGTVRIGIAIASIMTRLPRPLQTLPNDENFTEQLQQIIDTEAVGTIVIGLPRGLNGQETNQTKLVRDFVVGLNSKIDRPLPFQDEALSSSRAKQELEARGRSYQKGDVDALAATYILEDYLATNEV
ncbi:MAG: Holliday junction resolvase RuvX [Patescibacteria group bacterium]|nr:Holliday junction resolvase RuvX [Patescibacteria group bacterium]